MMNKKIKKWVLLIDKIFLSSLSGMGYLFLAIINKCNVWVAIFCGMVMAILSFMLMESKNE